MDSMESGGELCFLSFPPFSDSVGNTLNFEFYLNTLKSSQILKFVLPVVVRTVMNSFFKKKIGSYHSKNPSLGLGKPLLGEKSALV